MRSFFSGFVKNMKILNLSSAAITVTGSCTLVCKHCYSDSSPRVTDQFTFEELKRILSDVKLNGIEHVFLGGGEPLLHPRLSDVVALAKGKQLNVAVSTNGQLITYEILARLLDAGLTHDLSVSLDGPTAKINDYARGKGSFAKTLQGMYILNRFGKIVWGLNQVVYRQNLGFSGQTADLAKRLGASYFNLIRFTPFGRGRLFSQELTVTKEEYLTEAATLDKKFSRMGNFYNDVLLYDLIGGLAGRAVSYFDDDRFGKMPLGISVERDGVVYLTPARIFLGNCKTSALASVLDKLSDPATEENFEKWRRNQWMGVHQPITN